MCFLAFQIHTTSRSNHLVHIFSKEHIVRIVAKTATLALRISQKMKKNSCPLSLSVLLGIVVDSDRRWAIKVDTP